MLYNKYTIHNYNTYNKHLFIIVRASLIGFTCLSIYCLINMSITELHIVTFLSWGGGGGVRDDK